ncbi:MAG TPA: VOC family protein [Candidatus Binatia bacterium]|nr:VOC family protein [Candidatus Binatia bacterium]
MQIAIPRGSEERARAFYVELLGFDEVPKPPELAVRGGVWLRGGGANLHLGADPDFRAARKSHPAFVCADYDALLRHLSSRGVPIERGENLFEGNAHCYVTDPFGNRIELIAEQE